MTSITPTSSFVSEAEIAAVAFLSRYSGRTLEAYRLDLRTFFQCAQPMSTSWSRLSPADNPRHLRPALR